MDYLSDIFTAALWGTEQPKEPEWIQWHHRYLSDNHCEECVVLDSCWFSGELAPRWPHHPFCHCVQERMPYTQVLANATATAAYSKFDPYLFDTNGDYGHQKDKLFAAWGYFAEDAAWLQQEIERQGLQKYVSGEYTLGRLNKDGQRISIIIEIERKDKRGTVTFVSGWMVYPNGHIQLTTPYGGK